ncbi:MAG: tetratricopeptide repeat protein [Planctomycetota bacterium]|nr:tetratricopeptide repeat protein [Planctomycetota bacterium]
MTQGLIQKEMADAVAHQKAGRLVEAERACRRILEKSPNQPGVIYLLGYVLFEAKQFAAAVEVLRHCVATAPQLVGAYNILGMALRELEKFDDAIPCFVKALQLKPDAPEIVNNLANLFAETGKYEQAILGFHKAIALRPGYPPAHTNLGNALSKMGRFDEAIAQHQRALALDPNYVQAHFNLANALAGKNQMDEAIVSYRKALAFQPTLTTAMQNLGNAHLEMGQLNDAVNLYVRAMTIQRDKPDLHSCLLYAMQFDPRARPTDTFAEHVRWNLAHGVKGASQIKPFPKEPLVGRRLRIGYVSADFYDHSVASFFEPLLAAHHADVVEVFCYANVARPDETTARLQKLTPHWHDIAAMTDDAVATMIRGHGIDILVDLSGHTGHNRLMLFARKPAPVQVTYLGYPDTTGLSAIDYRITDALADPPGMTEKYHSEKLARMPESFLCFSEPRNAPAVGPLPAAASGSVTFGSFNAAQKSNADVVGIWAAILKQVPKSRMMFKSKGLSNASARKWLLDLFAARSIGPERIVLRDWIAGKASHLLLYGEIDIALDTFPYNGTTTTCEALWMGAPVITLAGEHHRSRVGASILTNVGLGELIAKNAEEYTQKAVGLAGDLTKLGAMRAGLRPRMAKSPLMDAGRFAGNLEKLYQGMWEARAKS